MSGVIQLQKNGSKITAILLYFLISHATSKGDINTIPRTMLDVNLLQPYEIRRGSLTIQDGYSSSPRLISKRNEVVPEDVPVRTEEFLQSFLKLTPQAYSHWQEAQSGTTEGAQYESLVEDDRFTLKGSKRDLKKVTKDFPQRAEKKPVKLLLSKSTLDAIQQSRRLPTRNWAFKRWWGGYYRPRPQMDRRAVKSKHYKCLKQCIGAGRLHPIQCHTLC